MLSFIVALAQNNEIGLNDTLPWHIKEDLRYFKKVTTNNTIIMGRKTYQSLPHKLPNRKHIVLTRDPNYTIDDPDITILYDIEQIKNLANDPMEYFVIGGAEIFTTLMPYANKFYFTFIHKTFDADAFFPPINFENLTLIEESEKHYDEKEDAHFTFKTFAKK